MDGMNLDDVSIIKVTANNDIVIKSIRRFVSFDSIRINTNGLCRTVATKKVLFRENLIVSVLIDGTVNIGPVLARKDD